jgi:hypothetical protein
MARLRSRNLKCTLGEIFTSVTGCPVEEFLLSSYLPNVREKTKMAFKKPGEERDNGWCRSLI